MKLFLVKALRHIIFSIFTALIFAGALFSAQLIIPSKASAETCTYTGQCINNRRCLYPGGEPTGPECGSAIIGGVGAPAAVANINAASGGEIGAVFFVSRTLNFANIIAGILVMLNFVYTGFLYITGAGSASNMSKMNQRLTWSFVGILLIVGSYTLAGIFGVVFYGDPTFIITPTLRSALD